ETVVLTVAVWPSPPVFTSWLGPPAVAVAVNVTGEPGSAAAVAVRESRPTAVPSCHEPARARPFASVVSTGPGTLPWADTTANVTGMPGTGFPYWSRTITVGATVTVVLTAAVCP